MIATRCFALLVLLVAVGGGECLGATEHYNVDADHSIVGFSVAHMVISKTTGRFTDYTGFIEMDPDGKTVMAIEAVIKTASVDSNHQKRDTHLRSPDFFNVEKYPGDDLQDDILREARRSICGPRRFDAPGSD